MKRDSHYVQQAYLRAWSVDDHRIWAYQILRSHREVEPWRLRRIKSTAMQTDLYTVSVGGTESDEIETWLEQEFETPARDALARVWADEPLCAADWERLVRYAVAQDCRTPAAYLEHLAWANKTYQPLMDEVLARAPEQLKEAKRRGKPLRTKNVPRDPLFPFTTKVEQDNETGKTVITAEVTIGRISWLHNIRHRLTHSINHFPKHDWTILRPSPGLEWFTSDHPLMRLNWYGGSNYTFDAGWGSHGSDIVFPLSPRHLLYTRIGYPRPPIDTASGELTQRIQEVIAKHAFRWIFAARKDRRVAWFRASVVDPVAYHSERHQWKNWHQQQAEAEKSM